MLKKNLTKTITWLKNYAPAIVFSTTICILGVVYLAYSASSTTIGENISTAGTLTITGNATFSSDFVLNNTSTSTVTMTNGLNFGSGTFVIDPNLGRVGIGTAGPITQLHIPGRVPVTEVGSATTGADPRRVFVQGRFAYVVTSGGNTLEIYDVSSTTPSRVSSLAVAAEPYDIYVQGSLAYISGTSGIRVI